MIRVPRSIKDRKVLFCLVTDKQEQRGFGGKIVHKHHRGKNYTRLLTGNEKAPPKQGQKGRISLEFRITIGGTHGDFLAIDVQGDVPFRRILALMNHRGWNAGLESR